jgi:succinate-semialdehyde dehydrogenase/glutarate-semialdehyde dehydrogenase
MTQIRTLNPATGEELARYDSFTVEQVDAAVGEVHAASVAWAAVPAPDRAQLLGAVAAVLRERREDLARLISREMGKPLAEALAEVDKCAWNCDYYSTDGVAFLEPDTIATSARSSYVTYEALGVIYAVMPWNFPFWQFFRFAAPALLAGNAVLLKHAPNVSGCALAIEDVLRQAGVPDGVVRALLVAEDEVGDVTDRVLQDPRVAAATLTGSTRAGSHVAGAAGRALKKSVLELGGSDPFVVLADADVATAAEHAAKSRLMCAGQTCIAAKRVIVHRDVAEEFQQRFLAAVGRVQMGDPLAEGTTLGPLARADLLDSLERQVRESVEKGATVLCGGERRPGEGLFFAPTVLTDVDRTMPVFAEETFGPVAVLVTVDGDDEAVAVANDTEYGLAASVWSRDIDHAMAVGARIRSGALFVNSFVSSDPRMPFGGTKRSGYGRELGAMGVREFTNARSVWIAPDATPAPVLAQMTE